MVCNASYPGLSALSGKRIIVTGGAGFIGSELMSQASAAGAEATAVDNLVNGKPENLAGIKGARLEVADIRDTSRMASLLHNADVVFHLACLGVRHSIHSPRENHDVNATATLDLLSLARAKRVPRFIYVSSSEVYGTARSIPMTEEHPTFPMTVYGSGKLAGECYARAYWETYRYPVAVVRPFNAFGPRSHHEGDCGEVIPRFMLRAMAGQPLAIFGDGNQTRDFTFVADTARGILLAGASESALGQTFNLGSGHEVTINHLARMISTLVPCGSARIEHHASRPGDVLRLYSDSTKARDLLGFTPEVSLVDGLTRLHSWYAGLDAAPEDLLRDERLRNWTREDSPSDA